jgi:hypothetical protein
MTLAVYQNSKHSHGAALAIEFFLPGGGSIYGDHLAGALLTWGLEIGGVLLILTSFATQSTTDGTSTQVSEARLTLGMLALMGGRIYGLVDAWRSTTAYNLRLRQLMGLPDWLAVGVTPIRTRDNVAYAPTLRLAF